MLKVSLKSSLSQSTQKNTFLSQKMIKNVSVVAINISRYTNQLEVLPIFAILR